MVAANLQHNVSHVVMFNGRDFLSAEANDNLVTRFAVFFFIMTVEFVIAHHPGTELGVVAITGYLDLYSVSKHLGLQ